MTDILGEIKVPTLLLFRKGDIEIRVEEGRYLADRIKNALLVTFEGDDHLFWTGDTYPVVAEIQEFITGIRPAKSEFTELNGHTGKKTRDLETIMSENFLYNLKIEEFAALCGRSLSAFKRGSKPKGSNMPKDSW